VLELIRSAGRVLTTHVGSLPRPEALKGSLARLDSGEELDMEASQWSELVRGAVEQCVAHQVAAGVDIVNDGEMAKVSYATYICQRASGFGGVGRSLLWPEADDFPTWAEPWLAQALVRPACVADVVYHDSSAVEADIDNLEAALRATPARAAFLTASSPGLIAMFLENQHYPTHEAYLQALAEALKTEYDLIHRAGYLLQVDCPDLADGRGQYPDLSLSEWRRLISQNVEALNHATRDIPPDSMRMHICWGNYEGPHHKDVALADVIDIVLSARPAAISFEAANPRHAHEWRLFEEVPLPDGKVLIPGVIDSTTNYVEHPELVADRICQFATLVGRERLIAGTDCGFGTHFTDDVIDPEVVFAKLRALHDGAELASARLWANVPSGTPA
jgi:5-methyltetrahydropteroyltriglutamate--homocysteine methyltransferase